MVLLAQQPLLLSQSTLISGIGIAFYTFGDRYAALAENPIVMVSPAWPCFGPLITNLMA